MSTNKRGWHKYREYTEEWYLALPGEWQEVKENFLEDLWLHWVRSLPGKEEKGIPTVKNSICKGTEN